MTGEVPSLPDDIPDGDQLAKVFGREAADFILTAASLGWKVVSSMKGTSISLIPYEGVGKRIHLSSRNRKNSNLFKRHGSTLVRYGEPERVSFFMAVNESDQSVDSKKALHLTAGMDALIKNGAFSIMPEEAPKERHVPTPSDLDKQIESKVKAERHIVSERPSMVRRYIAGGQGRSTPSQTTIERKWSDGTTDYACSVPTCDKTTTNRRGLGGAHWAMHVRNGEAEPITQDSDLVDDPSYTEPGFQSSRKNRRIADLTRLLKGINLSTISPEDLAEQITEFLGSSGEGNGNSGEPLTDVQVLDRIRSLVDRGTYAAQEEALVQARTEADELAQAAQEREDELVAKVEANEARAVAAESHLTALKDLITGIEYGEKKGE